METKQLHELLYQALETEIGGQAVYKAAIRCAGSDELRKEWEKYLSETEHHEEVLRDVFKQLDLDPEQESPGRKILRDKAQGLVSAMEAALKAGQPHAQLIAAESVVEAESKDHQNWELIGMVAKGADGTLASALKKAHEEVEDEEDEHLYHTMGWARELWAQSLGMPAVIPPPEEEKKVKTMAAASEAKNSREQMLR